MPSNSDVDASTSQQLSSELLALMLRSMEGDPRLASAFAALKQDAERAGLLGNGADWQGAPRAVTYERAIARIGPAPAPEHLSQMLGRLVDVSRQEADRGGTRLPMAPWSLLRTGPLALTEARSAQWSATHRVVLPSSREASVRLRPVGGPVASGRILEPPQSAALPVSTPSKVPWFRRLYWPNKYPISFPPTPMSPAGTSLLGPRYV